LTAVPLDHPINTKVTSEWVNLTPAMAEKLLGQNHGNRNVRSRKVGNYARDMRNGKWLTTGDSIKVDWNGRMIDGQHRCEAVIESGVTIRVMVVKGLEPNVQSVLDVNVRRSPSDALKFNGHSYNVSILASCARIANARALGYLTSATSTTIPEMTNGEVLQWVAENPEIENAAALASRVHKTIGATPSALAYAILTLEKINAPAAVEFFTSMAEFRTDGANDPRSTLLRTFNRLKEQRVTLTPAIQLSYIFRAWNAWRSNKKITNLPTKTSTTGGGSVGVAIPEPK
jgi:hypothetical protein